MRIALVEGLASQLVGDGQEPNVYFVSVKGECELITIHGDVAYDYWLHLPRNVETSLEDRLTGTLADTAPADDDDPRLITQDDYKQFTQRRKS